MLFQEQFQPINQLYVGNLSTCVASASPVPSLPLEGDGVTFVAFFARQGAAGWIAFLAILMIFKVAFNVRS